MSLTLFVLDVILILGALIDMTQTTFGAGRSGWISAPVTRGIWRIAFGIYRRRGLRTVLAATGPLILLLIPLLWTSILWIGWLGVFSSDPYAVVEYGTRAPVDLWG